MRCANATKSTQPAVTANSPEAAPPPSGRPPPMKSKSRKKTGALEADLDGLVAQEEGT
jgi:hypothetical protein